MTDRRQVNRIPKGQKIVRQRRALQAFRVAGGGQDKLNELVNPGAYGSINSADTPFTVVNPLQVLFVTTGSTGVEVQMPEVDVYTGSTLHVKKLDGNTAFGTVYLNTTGNTTIEGGNSVTITAMNEAMSVVSDGEDWHIINRYTLRESQVGGFTGSSPTFYIVEPGTGFGWPTGADAITVYLPDARNYRGVPITITKTDAGAGAITVTRKYASQTIDGAATYVLANNYSAVTVISDGSVWWVVGESS